MNNGTWFAAGWQDAIENRACDISQMRDHDDWYGEYLRGVAAAVAFKRALGA